MLNSPLNPVKKYRVLIIGAGQMGAFYDSPESDHVLSHAHGVCQHDNFELVGFVDASFEQAKKAASRWGSQAFSTIQDAFASTAIDGVIVTTPDATHADVLTKCAQYPIQFAIAEKPFTGNSLDASRIIKLYAQHNILLIVNYTRRFVPEIQSLRDEIKQNQFGKLLSGHGYYGKGWRHNGSHFVNLLQFLFEEVAIVGSVGKPMLDYTDSDPSYHKLCQINNDALISINAVDSRVITVFECDLLFEKMRIRILDSGLILSHPAVMNPVFKGYIHYGSPTYTQLSFNKALEGLLNHVAFALTQLNKKTLQPTDTIGPALKTLHLLEATN